MMTVKIKAYSDFIYVHFCFLGKGPFDEILEGKGCRSGMDAIWIASESIYEN